MSIIEPLLLFLTFSFLGAVLLGCLAVLALYLWADLTLKNGRKRAIQSNLKRSRK